MKKPSLLISVLNYNNFNSTKKCVDSLIEHIREEEIFIIDNNSPDNSFIKLKNTYKTLKVIKSIVNGGYASGHKIAVDYAIDNNFDLIWILNNDLTVRKNTLTELLLAYKKIGLGLYGSVTLKSENPDIINFGGGDTDDINQPFEYNNYEDWTLKKYRSKKGLRKVQSIEGSSFLIPIPIITKYGFMREDFFMYGEDTDYCYKLKKYGVNSYIIPNSIVIHKGAESLKKTKYLEMYYRRRNFLYFQKEHYNYSIIKQIRFNYGLISIIKFFIKNLIKRTSKKNLYYLNMGNIHALINKRGEYKD